MQRDTYILLNPLNRLIDLKSPLKRTFCKIPFTYLCFTDESMEEEDDSDLETTRVASRASAQSVVNSSVEMLDTDVSQRPQLNPGQSSHLDNVNFNWLQDYFALFEV